VNQRDRAEVMLCNEASSGKPAEDTREEEVLQEIQEPVSMFDASNVLQAFMLGGRYELRYHRKRHLVTVSCVYASAAIIWCDVLYITSEAASQRRAFVRQAERPIGCLPANVRYSAPPRLLGRAAW
jgi:hypothetical protein